MNDDVRAEIAAAAMWHLATDVARHYGISSETVHRIAEQVEPAFDFPNITSTKSKADLLAQDVRILRARGMNNHQIGEQLSLHHSRISQIAMGR